MNAGAEDPKHPGESAWIRESSPPLTCVPADQNRLLQLARDSIRAAIQEQTQVTIHPGELTPALNQPAATFVTLSLNRQLRGCVGNLEARDPLYRSVMINAAGAALRDARFRPVTLAEAEVLEIQISILSALRVLRFQTPAELLAQIRPGVDGVVLRQAGNTSTFLPQVWVNLTDKTAFMRALSAKCGLAPDAWGHPDTEVLVYQVSAFGNH